MPASVEEGQGFVIPKLNRSTAYAMQDTSMSTAGSGGLLMRFFESEFFDAWIAVSYLHKDLPATTREYLCRRIYMLPEAEVEPYVSQLCHLYVSKGGDDQVAKLLVDLCANSLNIAVKTYWILLAISQDRQNDESITMLKDKCELAGLSGHWELPFKDATLPSPIPKRRNRFLRHSINGQAVSNSLDRNDYGGLMDLAGTSPDAFMERRYSAHSMKEYPGESRSPSPDGLGNGVFSSVFVDTGVEGLIYESRHQAGATASQNTVEEESVSGASNLHESVESLRSTQSNVTLLVGSKDDSSALIEAPSSPKRRETTFGATLDFVEALCSASSVLTSVSESERQWALHKALRNINTEIEKASSSGVAIWFPMTRAAPQRVVRIAYRESRLLNSREKAPFTLYVEVLNEDTAVLEAQGVLSPQSRRKSSDLDSMSLENLAKTLDAEQFGFNAKAAAEEAAAAGIEWMPQHHRRNSSHDFTTSNLDASIALEAVKGSSAAEKYHEQPTFNESLQLTPSIASQRSDVSVMAAELSSESREASPVNYSVKISAQEADPVHLPRPHVQGGGTWIGRNLKGRSQSAQDDRQYISSPKIQAAIDGFRGRGPLVSLKINVAQPASNGHAYKQSAQKTEQRCINSTFFCKIGMCRCKEMIREEEEEVQYDDGKIIKLTMNVRKDLDLTVKPQSRHKRMPSQEALLQVAKQHKLPPPTILATIESGTEYTENVESRAKPPTVDGVDVYGEKWTDRKERIRRRSPHGSRPGWDLTCVIVKSGDDCRQELLSMQLIRTFHSIFAEAGLPLWLRPYEVLVTSSLTALIEMVPNAPSIHNVKSSFPSPDMSLKDHFVSKYGRDTPEFDVAQNNFVESMAAYSLVCYLLQIRDRHNGNLLLDDDGHIIHIDFGFMLSNSPGGVNFESAPFKLTRELLEIMDSDSEGTSSAPFDYYKVLMIQGFIAIRKHADRIVEMVSMMSDSGCPCFKNKIIAVEGLKKRLVPGVSEENLVKHVLGLIGDSLDAWRTRQYDYYQRVLNGIM